VGVAVGDAVGDAVGVAVHGAVGVAVHGAVGVAVRDAVHGAVGDAVHGAVGDAMGDAVRDAVRAAVGDAVDGAVGVAVRDAVHGAVGVAVRVAVGDAVHGAVRDAVGDAVGGAVRDAVDRQQLPRFVADHWYRYIGGQFWVGGWYWGSPAYVSYFLDVCGLRLPLEMELRARAYAAVAESACWWYPCRDICLVSERPTALEVDDSPGLETSQRLRRVEWSGWGLRREGGVLVTTTGVERAP